MTAAPAVRMRGIVKRYTGVVALGGVDLEVQRGHVHAIAGENGAGKTTLMRVLYGLTRPDAGEMALDGRPFTPRGPRDALAHGVGMVHQHFMLIPTLTVLENAVLGQEPLHGGVVLDRAAGRRLVTETAERFGLDLDPDAKVEALSVGERQRLEILKVLLRGASILVLDEPTAVLVPGEARTLLRTVRGLAEEGAAVLFITHRLGEVIEHADVVTVLRRGRTVGSAATADTDERELARMMMGREPAVRDALPRRAPGDVVLRLENVAEPAGVKPRRLGGVSLEVRAGEILGMAGVEGNGQRELGEIIAGLRPFQGTVTLGGRSVAGRGPADVRRLGLAHVPEDRLGAGLIPAMTAAENLLLGLERQPRFRRGLSFDRGAVARHARERLEAFDVRPARPDLAVSAFSGGNQQKIVISREAEGDPGALLVMHPTRGVDVGARDAIHDVLLALRDRGAALFLVSADLPELLVLSDRIVVLYAGRLAGEFARGEADEEALGIRMTGGTG